MCEENKLVLVCDVYLFISSSQLVLWKDMPLTSYLPLKMFEQGEDPIKLWIKSHKYVRTDTDFINKLFRLALCRARNSVHLVSFWHRLIPLSSSVLVLLSLPLLCSAVFGIFSSRLRTRKHHLPQLQKKLMPRMKMSFKLLKKYVAMAVPYVILFHSFE